ncbi:uncharacterized protein GGS22DRAFT_185672 [Annulohypoxylon maeteangense]|uniref:uncharacterized protein n=1 Tax=Annulohypoxylon maeteangense TaxID=1927788 RepID=UPI002008DEBA|nr:uncharacterized protein GGS22DRAFT_185672 [Annulohypoxylon maeteangense]KAI0888293.1 hypothetical protein GGS22DRAFT_185672 [Annulohypoxylon maeteangense]
MADRNYRGFLKPSSARAGPRSNNPRSHTAYPDVWMADSDRHHLDRVQVFNKRRDSIASSSRSRPGTPLRHDPSKPSMRIEKHRSMSTSKPPAVEFLEKDWRKSTPWAKDKEMRLRSSLSPSIDTPTSTGCMSPIELQDELDRYSVQSQYLLTDNEWVSPPGPRGRTRRIDPKEFNKERVKTLKRWNTVQGFMYGMNSSTLRETDVKQPRDAYFPGVVFSAPVHTAVASDELHVPNDDPHLTATPFGTLNSKYRKMIVYRVFGEHLQCLPIYTHNGRGLEGKEFPEEFVSIRDVDDPHPNRDEGPYIGIDARRERGYRGMFIQGKAVVKLTESYTHRYEAPATIEGRVVLHNNCRERLFDLVKYKSR